MVRENVASWGRGGMLEWVAAKRRKPCPEGRWNMAYLVVMRFDDND